MDHSLCITEDTCFTCAQVLINHSPAKVLYLYLHSHEVVSCYRYPQLKWLVYGWKLLIFRWSKVSQVDLTAKLCLSFCLELQSAKSNYQHVDLYLYWWNTQRLEFDSRSSEVIRVFFYLPKRFTEVKLGWARHQIDLAHCYFRNTQNMRDYS